MVKPTPSQLHILVQMRLQVIEEMKKIGIWSDSTLSGLEEITLGVLRRDSTQKHGVTRWKKGTQMTNPQTKDVDVIDIHPILLKPEWWSYARFVMYHEFLHALGNIAHDKGFKKLESLWTKPVEGKEFTEQMRIINSTWIWRCNTCGKGYPRRKRSLGRYRCRTCNCVLIDEMNKIATRS